MPKSKIEKRKNKGLLMQSFFCRKVRVNFGVLWGVYARVSAKKVLDIPLCVGLGGLVGLYKVKLFFNRGLVVA